MRIEKERIANKSVPICFYMVPVLTQDIKLCSLIFPYSQSWIKDTHYFAHYFVMIEMFRFICIAAHYKIKIIQAFYEVLYILFLYI